MLIRIGMLLGALLSVQTAFAQVDDDGAADSSVGSMRTQSPSFRHENLGLGVEYAYSHFTYEEPKVMKSGGNLNGFRLSYEREWQNAAALTRMEFEYLGGAVAYDGSLQNTRTGEITPYQTKAMDSARSFRIDVGFPAFVTTKTNFMPFAGIANRHLYDKNEGRGAYGRDIDQYYLPGGLQVRHFFNDEWSAALTAEVDFFLLGTVTSVMSDIRSDLPDLVFHQRTGLGYRLAGLITRDVRGYVIRVQPYWQHWSIDRSDIDSGYVEPRNETDFVGATFGIQI